MHSLHACDCANRTCIELDADKKLEFDFNSATSRISASTHPMGIGLKGGEGYILSPIDLHCIAQSSMNAHNAY